MVLPVRLGPKGGQVGGDRLRRLGRQDGPVDSVENLQALRMASQPLLRLPAHPTDRGLAHPG